MSVEGLEPPTNGLKVHLSTGVSLEYKYQLASIINVAMIVFPALSSRSGKTISACESGR